MAKPTYSLGGLDFDTLVRVNAFLAGTPAATVVAAAPPLAATAAPPPPPPPAPPLAAPAAPPLAAPVMPAAPAAPPPPPVTAPAMPAAPAAPPTGGIDFAAVTQAMSAAVGKKGGAVKCSQIIARYNATAPGTPGPLSVVAPEQYGNIKAEFDAITPDP